MLVAQYASVGAINTLTAERALVAFARAVLATLCLQASLWAAPAAAAGLLTLGGDRGPVSLATSLDTWLDAGGQTSVETVEAGPPHVGFTPLHGSKSQALDNAALWFRFDAVVRDPRDHWKLELPMAAVDKIRLYYRDSLGHWVVQQAGDTLPMSA